MLNPFPISIIISMRFSTVSFNNNRLRIIDQRHLPQRLVYRECKDIRDAYYSIKRLAVRGAPLIGVFAAYALYAGVRGLKTKSAAAFISRLSDVASYLKSSRPTAVNLSWAVDRMILVAMRNSEKDVSKIKRLLLDEAIAIHDEDRLMCDSIGANGSRLIRSGDRILTHCNAGALATSGIGTALAIIYKAKRQRKILKVYADETRPLLQGARLTAWELKNSGIDVTLLCDNMAAVLMKQAKIDKVIVGADRIASNGDFANKIGTYALAVLAHAHRIPFYVAAPSSTFDMSLKDGTEIPIENRPPDEVRAFISRSTAPKGIKVFNPAFDVTPGRLVTAIITENGIFCKPYKTSLKRAIRH